MDGGPMWPCGDRARQVQGLTDGSRSGSCDVCGSQTLTEAEAREAGFAGVYALSDLEPDRARSMSQAAELLAAACEKLALRLTP
jgi:hypothetical protein